MTKFDDTYVPSWEVADRARKYREMLAMATGYTGRKNNANNNNHNSNSHLDTDDHVGRENDGIKRERPEASREV